MPAWLAHCAPRTAPRAFVWYVLLTIAYTWPVTADLGRNLPRDLGDPLLNCWILGWNAHHLLEALRGHFDALRTLWHGNFFHPEPYTLAYSELMLAQAVQIAPVYAITNNLVLCYNLLFLSTFALSGLGAFLLARAYLGDWRAAFIAGLLFAFTPYRVNQGPHLQVMSSQWMPFALLGFHRFVESRSWRALAGGTLALVAQNLSCGYFLVFFSLFVPPFLLWEMLRYRAWRDRRVWAGLMVAGLVVGALTLASMQPYFALRALHGSKRPIEEILIYSADVWGYLSAEDQLAFWGPRLRVFVRPEGQLFPGALPLVLTIVGAVSAAIAGVRSVRSARAPESGARTPGEARKLTVAVLTWIAALSAVTAGIVLLGLRQFVLAWAPAPPVRLENLLMIATAAVGLLVWLSPSARGVARLVVRSPLAWLLCCALIALYLSLGPEPKAGGVPIHGPRVYRFLLNRVPGFDGLRVAARFAMIVMLFLSLTSAWGARALISATRHGALVVTVLAILWMAETWAAPFPVNQSMGSDLEGVHAPPTRPPIGAAIPAISSAIQALPANAVLAEFPFGVMGWEVRYMAASTNHWRRMLNGYSGYMPRIYQDYVAALREPHRNPDAAWNTLLSAGTTHVIVHGQAYASRSPPAPYEWLEGRGARAISIVGLDTIYEMPR